MSRALWRISFKCNDQVLCSFRAWYDRTPKLLWMASNSRTSQTGRQPGDPETHFNRPVLSNSYFSSTGWPFSSTGREILKTASDEAMTTNISELAMSFPGHSRRPNPKTRSCGSVSGSVTASKDDDPGVAKNRSGRNSEGDT